MQLRTISTESGSWIVGSLSVATKNSLYLHTEQRLNRDQMFCYLSVKSKSQLFQIVFFFAFKTILILLYFSDTFLWPSSMCENISTCWILVQTVVQS